MRRAMSTVLLASAFLSTLWAQTAPSGPVYDVVSIRRSSVTNRSGLDQRPDGGFTAVGVPVTLLIARAYAPVVLDTAGLPDWASREQWDVTTTATRANVTMEERAAMLRAMLADRFKLVAHAEKRPREVYELVPARADGRLGPGLQKLDIDCTAIRAAARAAGTKPPAAPSIVLPPPTPGGAPRLVASEPPAPCNLLMTGENLQGQGAIGDLLVLFRAASGRDVVDRSGLTGFYQITMRYDQAAARRPPMVVPPPDAAPSVFTAVQEQLGLRLVGATVDRDVIIIDRLERPTEN
jgi:uncharacterized protein (TIGR03435 family)